MLSTASCLVSERCIVCSMDLHVHVVPAILVCASLVLAYYVPKIKTPSAKKWMSTLVGLVYILGLAGLWGTLDLLLMVVVNAGIIVWGNKRYCFSLSFSYSFAQLTLFNHEEIFPGLGGQRERTFPLMMGMLWKMIHLAGEVQDTFLSELNDKKPTDSRMKIYSDLSYGDVFHFGFCYAGFVNFFRYRTYYDWLHYSFYNHSKRFGLIVRRVKTLVKLGIVIGPTNLLLPYNYIALTDDFYYQSFPHRMLYAVYSGLGMHLLLYAMFVAEDIYNIASGMGAYPSATNPKPGRGPTQRLELLEQIAVDPDLAQLQEYNYDTVRNIYLSGTITAPTFRAFWKNYNVCSQYALVENVFKRFPFTRFRILFTFLVSGVWHGMCVSRAVSGLFFAAYIHAEDILYALYVKNDHSTGAKPKILGALFWASHVFGNGHMFFAVIEMKPVYHFFRFYAAIWYIPLVYPFALWALALVLRFLRKTKNT